ncbi:hypothetical protein [Microlunatus endophyticus]
MPLEDAVGDDVVAGVECVADGGVDQADVRQAGLVVFSEDGSAEVVLFDPGDSAAELVTQALGDGGFSRC